MHFTLRCAQSFEEQIWPCGSKSGHSQHAASEGDHPPPAPVRRMRPAAREGSLLEAGPRTRRAFTSSPQAFLLSPVSTGGPEPSRYPKGSDTGLQAQCSSRCTVCVSRRRTSSTWSCC